MFTSINMLYKVHFQLRKISNELNLLGNRKLFIYSCFAIKKVQHRNFWCRWIILAVFSATEAVVSIARRIQAWAGIQTWPLWLQCGALPVELFVTWVDYQPVDDGYRGACSSSHTCYAKEAPKILRQKFIFTSICSSNGW